MPKPPAPPSGDAAAMPPVPAPARQRRKAERPQELLDAALSQFVSKGLAATRMDDVARQAGVSKGTLYLYYPSKDELFKAVVRNSVVTVLTEGSDIVDRFEGPTSELLALLMHTWWSRIGNSKASGIFKLVVADVGNMPELAKFYLDEVIVPTHQLLGRAVERGVARGEFRPMDVTAVVQSLMAPAQFLMLYPYCMGSVADHPFPLDADTFMKTQMELLLHGLEVRGRA
jgi:AcrR family transcriptional regulator